MKLNNRNKIQLTDDESRNIRVFSDILNAENNRVFLVSIGKSAVNQALMLQCNSFIVDCDIPGNESLQNRPEHYFSEI